MKTAIIKGKKYLCFDIYNTKESAFERAKSFSNNTKVFKTDDNKFALFIITQDVTNLY